MFSAGLTYYENEEETIPEIGFETGYEFILLNAGYKINVDEANKHIGMRIRAKYFTIGYAYIPGTYLDPSHRFSINYRFPGTPTKKIRKK